MVEQKLISLLVCKFQVPLALTIRVVQLKGTLQVRIKPPPSDRVWFSFTEMPALELLPEPCIGDHKINSGPLGAFIVNQIKVWPLS